MGYSYSKVDTYAKCPYRYKLHYLDKVKTYKNLDPDNPLICGTAMHMGVQEDLEKALAWYESQFPALSDEHMNEELKIEALVPKAKELVPEGSCFEVPLFDKGFQGFIDILSDDWLLDIKYSNQSENYSKSEQIHVYRWYAEKLMKRRPRNIGYLMIPKVGLKQTRSETIHEYRRRLELELEVTKPKIVSVNYSLSKVRSFFGKIREIQNATDFPKKEGWLCKWCEYEGLCLEGSDLEIDFGE